MKQFRSILPPRWASRLLAWYCKPELLEDLQGDLHEYFNRNVTTKGLFRARVIYAIDVLKFFRPYTARKPEFINLLIHWVMLASYVKTSRRSILRNKLFSAINIVGLAISMCVGLLMIAMMTDLLSYDKFHVNYDRIYRVINRYEFNGRKDGNFMATTSLKTGKAIRETFSGVDNVAILHRDFGGDITVGDKTIPLSGFWTDNSLLNVFSFQLLSGDRNTVLSKPFSVVFTERSAIKLFGHTDILGKVVAVGNGEQAHDYTITGVLKDVPAFSHMYFDVLGSLSTREVTERDNEREMAWDNVWHTWVYVLLPDKNAATVLQRNLEILSEREDKSVPYTHIEFAVQPLRDIVLGEGPDGRNLGNQIGETMGGQLIWVLGSLSFVVILCAGLNYTNLSIARSFRRTREIGVRKTIGAQRSHVINQFLVESAMIALFALFVSFGLFILIKPYFLGLEDSLRSLLKLELTPFLIAEFVIFAIIVGVCAGLFPALFFARVNAVRVFRNASNVPVFKGFTMRKVLITFQYCVSIIGITATLVIYKQYRHFLSFDLGFTTENVLNIRLQGNNADGLKARLSQLHEVSAISQSTMVPSVGSYWGTTVKNPKDPLDSTGVGWIGIDENYLPLHDHQFVAGENFKERPGKAAEDQVIVNQQTVKRFNIGGGNPFKAVGEQIEVSGKPMTIIGVIRDFQYGRANDLARSEVVMRYALEESHYLNVKILSSDWLETMARIESIWKQVDKVHPLEAKFYSDQIEEAFQGLEASMKIGSFLAFLVICISSIGLLGMVVYSTETRLREVSIRKVFGASEMRVVIILSLGFVWLLMLAAAIALPVTYIMFERVILPEMANHAPLGLLEMTMGVVAVLCVALVMIGMQAMKVARVNPSDALKIE